MKCKRPILFVCLILLVLGLFLTQANATLTTSTWDLTVTNDSKLVSGQLFATVTCVVDDEKHTATFTIDANQSILNQPAKGGNFGIDKFFFNTQLTTITSSDFNLAGSGWTVKTGQEGACFGKFELEYKGNGTSKIDPLTFTITDSNIKSFLDFYDANKNGFNFAAHIAGYTNGSTSGFFGDGTLPSVPEPSTLLLIGSGFVGLAIYRRMTKSLSRM